MGMEMGLLTTKIINILKVIYNESNPSTTFNEMLILECIKKENLTKTEIKKILLTDGATISRSVDKLLEKGMVERVKTTYKYSLTQEGKKVLVELDETSNFILAENFDGLSEDIDTTIKNLKVLVEKLEKSYEWKEGRTPAFFFCILRNHRFIFRKVSNKNPNIMSSHVKIK